MSVATQPHSARPASLSRAQRPSARRVSLVCRIASAARMNCCRAASCTRIVSSSRRVWLSASRKSCLSWAARFPHGHRAPARPQCVVPSSRFARAELQRLLLTPKLDHWPLWRPPRPWRAVSAALEPASGARRPGLARWKRPVAPDQPEFQLDQLAPRHLAGLLARHQPSLRLAPPARSPPPTARARSRPQLPGHLWGAIRPQGGRSWQRPGRRPQHTIRRRAHRVAALAAARAAAQPVVCQGGQQLGV